MILTVVALLGACAALSALPDAIARYRVEPEDVYGLAVFATLGLLLAGLWARLAWRAGRPRDTGEQSLGEPPVGRRAATLVIVLGVLIVASGFLDSRDGPIMFGVGGVTMASGALFFWLSQDRVTQ